MTLPPDAVELPLMERLILAHLAEAKYPTVRSAMAACGSTSTHTTWKAIERLRHLGLVAERTVGTHGTLRLAVRFLPVPVA